MVDAVNPRAVLSTLRTLPIFSSLSAEEALSTLRRSKVAVYRKGATIFREGEPGDTMMIVLKGRVQVSCRAEEGVDVEVAVLGPGDILGEMAVLDPAPRAARATAQEETALLVLDRDTLTELITEACPAASSILRALLNVLSKRLREMDERLELLFAHRLGAGERSQGGTR